MSAIGSIEKGDVVVVTGATAGVGRAAVRAFARRGAHLGLLARGRDGLDGARGMLKPAAAALWRFPLMSRMRTKSKMPRRPLKTQLGPINVWVNNAMVTVMAPFKETTADEFKRVTEVTYLGAVYGTMAALRRMQPRDRGTIVQAGSALAYRSIPLQAPYCGAKHAIRGFTDSLRSELLHDQSSVHLTMVQMPALNTPQFDWCRTRLPRHPQPVPPIFQPEDRRGSDRLGRLP